MSLNRLEQWEKDLSGIPRFSVPVMATVDHISVFDAIDILHGHRALTGDQIPGEYADKLYVALCNRLKNWDVGSKSTKKYDKRVKKLIKAVLEEYEANGDRYL